MAQQYVFEVGKNDLDADLMQDLDEIRVEEFEGKTVRRISRLPLLPEYSRMYVFAIICASSRPCPAQQFDQLPRDQKDLFQEVVKVSPPQI